jgi:hypothetical protein
MANLLAGLIGALIGVFGVITAARLQGRREHQRWLRDQKLHAAIAYIGATSEIYDRHRYPSRFDDSASERAAWVRAQDGRSALHLLCQTSTVDVAEKLIKRVRHTQPRSTSRPRRWAATRKTDETPPDDETIDLLRDLVRRLRLELDAGTG